MQYLVQSLKDQLDSNYLFVDLEVNSSHKIYRIGLSYEQTALDAFEDNFSEAYEQLKAFKEQDIFICGHNFRRFDYRYLTEQQPDFQSWLIIDTLELSVLAFPLLPSHKLNKDYKQNEYTSNNPLEDARATRLLLHQILDFFVQKPINLLLTYQWLLTCGNEPADQAYQCLFNDLEPSTDDIPFINKLPQEALIGFNQS